MAEGLVSLADVVVKSLLERVSVRVHPTHAPLAAKHEIRYMNDSDSCGGTKKTMQKKQKKQKKNQMVQLKYYVCTPSVHEISNIR